MVHKIPGSNRLAWFCMTNTDVTESIHLKKCVYGNSCILKSNQKAITFNKK